MRAWNRLTLARITSHAILGFHFSTEMEIIKKLSKRRQSIIKTFIHVAMYSLSQTGFTFLYRYKKPLIVHFKNGTSDWTDPMKWTRASLLKMYSDWSILSGTSEDIVRGGGNGDTQTSFNEYLEMMHEKKHSEEPM